jgi:hypothetical protein
MQASIKGASETKDQPLTRREGSGVENPKHEKLFGGRKFW